MSLVFLSVLFVVYCFTVYKNVSRFSKCFAVYKNILRFINSTPHQHNVIQSVLCTLSAQRSVLCTLYSVSAAVCTLYSVRRNAGLYTIKYLRALTYACMHFAHKKPANLLQISDMCKFLDTFLQKMSRDTIFYPSKYLPISPCTPLPALIRHLT